MLYCDGFAFQKGKGLDTWRWDEISVIRSDVRRMGSIGSRISTHEYTLNQRNGVKVLLCDRIKTVAGAAEAIKRQVFVLVLPQLSITLAQAKPSTLAR